MENIKEMFLSDDGNTKDREKFLGYLEELNRIIDSRKDENKASLNGDSSRDYSKAIKEAVIPQEGMEVERLLEEMDSLVAGHPYYTKNFMLNALAPASIPSLLGFMTAGLLSCNAIWDVASPTSAEAEIKSVAMMARIFGYNPKKAGGYFTYGGQGGIFNALRIGMEKAAPKTNTSGVSDNIYAICSDRAHFSLKKAVETGIGKNKVILVKTNRDTSINIEDFEKKLDQLLAKGAKIAVIIATTGTTDTFAIDDVGSMKDIIDEKRYEYGLDYIPHLHADGAMGGLYSLFNQYDLEENPLEFNLETVEALRKIKNNMVNIYKADSISLDFHKLGHAPYNNSLFIVKDNKDFNLVNLDRKDCPYVGEQGYGEYFTGYTLECSRMAAGIATYCNLLCFGVEGYQKLLAHYLNLSIEFRKKLEARSDSIRVINKEVPGPITLFRVYNNQAEYQNEIESRVTEEKILEINKLNEHFYKILRDNRENIMFGDTKQSIDIRSFDTKKRFNLNATKAFMTSPHTKVEDLDYIIDYLMNSYKFLFNDQGLLRSSI
ncbi:pyridoxal phosphate-dependent decarboxylase family protein [Halonatronum saccharophilum]|uniref:pyridoxal phosphate-dependent decarboxylase family protein n=1 Tax=Halonatronum saccharophilum TaxID=150060 RepID=UPI0004B53B7A|nr:pyridoxal-dependent decarboxylase [Halonatronum saccharophilum]